MAHVFPRVALHPMYLTFLCQDHAFLVHHSVLRVSVVQINVTSAPWFEIVA